MSFLIHLRSISTYFLPSTPLVYNSVYLYKQLVETPVTLANYYVCSSHCFNRLSRKAAIGAFNESYLLPRYLTIIYNCLIIYFTLQIHATTHDNLTTTYTTPFHQSAPNSWSDRRRVDYIIIAVHQYEYNSREFIAT